MRQILTGGERDGRPRHRRIGQVEVTRDLVAQPLAHIDPITTDAIRTPPETHAETVAAAYPAERAVLDEFLASDIVIVGAGQNGLTAAAYLARCGVSVMVLEQHDEEVRDAQERGWSVLQGDATDDRILELAGIERAKGLMSCVDSDANNVLLIMTARALSPSLIISARVSEERNIKNFKRIY